MALPTARPSIGAYRIPAHGGLLLLLLSLGWLQPLRTQVTETGQAELLDPSLFNTSDFTSPAMIPGPQACACLLSHVTEANCSQGESMSVCSRSTHQPSSLGWWAAQDPWTRTSRQQPGRFCKAEDPAMGSPSQQDLACSCPLFILDGPLYLDRPPSRWPVSTLDAPKGLLAMLDQPVIQDVPMRQGPCPPDRKPHTVDENLIFYEDWELEACVDGTLLDAQMDLVNTLPFTYQQVYILKCNLDQTYPQGYPESLVQRLGYFFRYVSPEDIHKWNLTSLETVKALLSVSKGQKMDSQVTALMARYVLGGGQLDQDTMNGLADFRPDYLCFLSAEQLDSVPSRVMWAIRPQDLDSCAPRQLDILYSKACLTFRNMSQPEFLAKIRAFLGGAPVEDLRTLILQNMTMDMATFKKLRVEAVVGLTVSEVQRLLGIHVGALKAEEANSPVRDWILQQRQEDLDTLGLGLQGGIPNGYLVLNLSSREAFSGVCPLCRPGLVLASTLALLLALTLS